MMTNTKQDYLPASERAPETVIKRLDLAAAEVRGALYGGPIGLMKLRGELSIAEMTACLWFAELTADYRKAIGAKGIKSPSAETVGKSEPPDPSSTVGLAMSRRERATVNEWKSARLAAIACGRERFLWFWTTVIDETAPNWIAKLGTRSVAAALAKHREMGSRFRNGRR